MIRDIPFKVILVLGFLISGLIPLLISFLLSFSTAREELKKQAFMQLESVRDIKKHQVERYYQDKTDQLLALAMHSDIAEVVAEFKQLRNFQPLGREPSGARLPMSPAGEISALERLRADARDILRFPADQRDWGDLFLLDDESGDRYFSVRDGRVAQSPGRGEYDPLREAWSIARRGEIALSDTKVRGLQDRRPIQLLAVPVRNRTAVAGVLAAAVPLDQIDRIMGERSGMGMTGESYLVGPDRRMRSGSYLDRQGRSVEASFRGTVAANGVDTRASRRALAGVTGAETLTDYRGQVVLSTYAPVQFFGLRWAIIAEIDEREIDDRIAAELNAKVLFTLGASTCLLLILALGISQVISGGIRSFITELERLIGQVLQGKVDGRGDPADVAHDFRGVMHQTNALVDALAHQMDEKRQLEAAMQFSQRMESIGALAGGIAHDFNNILSYMLAYADLVQAELPADSPAHENLSEVIRAIERAGELVSQILTFSRQARQEKQPLRVALIVKEAVKLLKATLPKSIQAVKRIEDENIHVLADPIQFHQIVMNLCTNAFQAMQEKGGVLTIGLARVRLAAPNEQALPAGLYCRLTISDTGCGMDAGTQRRMFEPFFTTKPVGQGSGMGLAVVHGIVTDCGGSIDVRSAPGQGTTVTVFLPLVEAGGERPGESECAVAPAGSGRILLVDDEPHICRSTRQVLQSLGYEVRTASGGREAAGVFAAEPEWFDLVLTDIQMRDGSGLDLLDRIRGSRPGLPVILVTGYSEVMDGDSARARGAVDLIQKPFSRLRVATAIQAALAGSPAGAQLNQDF